MPLTTCYGISDYTDANTGESDGKFTIKLHFSGKESIKEETKIFLEKLKSFEQYIIDSAVENSEAWFGKKASREIVEDRYFPFLKMGKDKETKKEDPSKGYYFRPRVNNYNGEWDVKLYDTSKNLIFPTEDPSHTPVDFVPTSGSDVGCGIECKHIWIGAKGWGVSWALKQAVVTPRAVEMSNDDCQLDISDYVPEGTFVSNIPPPVPEKVKETLKN